MMGRVFVHTFGCQMNENDSARMVESLAAQGYTRAEEPADADLILLNTCAIREKAEDKLYSALGRYRMVKAQRGARIGVAGCVAQQEKEQIFRRAPYVDFVFGPDQIQRLPEIVQRVEREGRVLETDWVDSEEYVFPRADPEHFRASPTAFVTAMKGCDNVCSFCVVPHTRGREVSRPYPELVAEVRDLCAAGVREVTLIGQNVNSYRGGCTFAELIRRVAEVPGLRRIRFTTSHPHDMSDALVRCFAPGEVPQLMPHLHLPVQSGSDAVLKRMRRDYTAAQYLDLVGRIRAAAGPRLALTTDIIVAFPGETDDDFEQTMRLLEKVRYDGAYSFLFSPRPHTAAQIHLEEWGSVPREVGMERLDRLQQRLREHGLESSRRLVGSLQEVLVEGASKSDSARRAGRTPCNRTVNFTGAAPTGALVRVRVATATPESLHGEEESLVEPPAAPAPSVTAPASRRSLPVMQRAAPGAS
jgi:tRNA-2-methylthio-N6-dimethylallyladenosine synthase